MNFKLNDRLTQGFIAGVAGWLPQMLFMQPMYWIFKLIKLQYLDYGAYLSFNHRPEGLSQFLFSEFTVVLFLGFLGVLFSMLIKIISSANLIFKGWLYGALLWFIIFSIFSLFKVNGVYGVIDYNTAIINLIGASIYGIGMSWTLLFLNGKYGVKN